MKKILVLILYLAIIFLAARCNSPTDVCTPFNFSEELLEDEPVIEELVDAGFIMTEPARFHDTYEGISEIGFSYINYDSDEEVAVTLVLLNDLRYNHNEMVSEAEINTAEMIDTISKTSSDIIYETDEEDKSELIVFNNDSYYGYYGEYNLYYTIGIQYENVNEIDEVREAVMEYMYIIIDEYVDSLNAAKEGTSCD